MVDTGSQNLPTAAPAPPEPRPRLLTVALVLVWIGVAVGVLDLAAGTAAVFTAIVVWREHIENYPVVLLMLAVPAAVGGVAAAGTVRLLRRTRERSRSGRVGLTTLMFCFVPGAAVNYSITELFLIFYALADWGSGGNGEVPDWAGVLMIGSMITDGVLLLIALVAGILLVLPACARYTNQP